jgi:hypothetical protein
VSPVLSVLDLLAYLAIAYLIGRLLVGLVAANPNSLVRATSPILGGSALAIQLWMYGAVHVPWNALTLLAPWLVAVVIRQRQLRSAVSDDWSGVWAESRLLARSGPLELVLLGGTVALGLVYLLNLVTQPVLGWDAIAMWLYKANLYYTQQAVNLAPISSDIRRNLDYPPLYSLMVDSLYSLTGQRDEIFGKAVTYLFVPTALVGFLVTARELLGRQLAITFTFLLAAMPIFLNAVFSFPYMGWADYPVGILMLVSLLHLLHGLRAAERFSYEPLHELRTGQHFSYALAVVYAALAALTKNEGLSFLAIVLILLGLPYLITTLRRRNPFRPDWTLVLVVLLGLAPLVAWQLYLKLNGIHSARLVSQSSWQQLLPTLPGRAVATLVSIRKLVSFQFDYPWLAVSYVLSVLLIWYRRAPFAWRILAVITLQAAGYFVVYLITPFDTDYIVSVTFDRLMLQMAPSLLLLLAVAVHPYLDSADAAVEDDSRDVRTTAAATPS